MAGNVVASEVVYNQFRFLDLSEQVLLAKAANPELIAQFRKGDPEKVKEALEQVEGVKLRDRSLRGASFVQALLPGADLRQEKLQGAKLSLANLQGAGLWYAKLQGANLSLAKLQGASLWQAELEGANLKEAELQGADLPQAELQGADLEGAKLQGTDLRSAGLYGAIFKKSRTGLLDLRSARWTPVELGRLAQLRELLGQTIADTEARKAALERIERAGRAGFPPPIFESCLIDPEVTPGLKCQRQWHPREIAVFQSALFPALEKLACQSSWAARVRQIDMGKTTRPSGRFGLAGRFAALLGTQECEGLSSLPEVEKNWIRDLVEFEEEEVRRRQSEAGKPAEEVPASPRMAVNFPSTPNTFMPLRSPRPEMGVLWQTRPCYARPAR